MRGYKRMDSLTVISNWFIFICLIFGFCFNSFAQKLEINISPYVGLSSSSLNFSIAGNLEGNSPNILSEIDWSKLKGIKVGSSIDLIYKKYLFNISYENTSIYAGTVTDKDYASDNRKDIYGNLLLSSHKGYERKFEIASGYILLKKNKYSAAIGLVFSNLSQKYYLLNFRNSNDTEIQNLNSHYLTNWKNYGVYLLGNYSFIRKNTLLLKASFQYSGYSAKANWNLIEDFATPISFIHNANGYSNELHFRDKYQLSDKLSLNLSYALFFGNAKDGVDELFLKNQTSVKTKLNNVRSVISVPSFGIVYRLK